MTPGFRIFADGNDLTDQIKRRFQSLSVKDEAGIDSDSFSLTLFDSPPISAPSEGSRIEIAMGYGENLIDLGVFATRPVSFKGPPTLAIIEGGVADCYPSLKDPRKKSWRPGSLGDMLRAICSNHNLSPSLDPICETIWLSHEDQTESDASLLARIAEQFDFIFKIQRDHLIFFDRDSFTAPSGKPIEVIKLKNFIDYDFKSGRETRFTGVKVDYWDKKTAKKHTVLSGVEGKIYAIKFMAKDEASAKIITDAKLRKLSRSTTTLSLTIPGDPRLFSGGRALIEALHPEINGQWILSSVEHSLDNSGFLSKVSLEGRSVS